MTAEIGEIKSSVDICFLYLNIVQISFINGRRRRLLCVCLIECKRGYTYKEFANPTYTLIEVQEFSDMSMSIRDIHRKLLDLDNRFDTVATLHMKKMQNLKTMNKGEPSQLLQNESLFTICKRRACL